MDAHSFFGLIIFICGYLLITFEHKIKNHKAAIALSLAGILWTIVALSPIDKEHMTHAMEEVGGEIFGIIAFLLSSMALIEILIHYNFFDVVRVKILKYKLSDKAQFFVMTGLTFFLSAVLDNLAITIVMIQIARQFFKGKNLLVAAAGIVIATNSGGAWSPVGDITTLMLWLANKFDTVQVMSQGFLPSFAIFIVSSAILSRSIEKSTRDVREDLKLKLTRGEKLVIGLSIASFFLPLFVNMVNLPPYIGRIFGLGIVWFTIEFLKARSLQKTHMEADLERLFKNIDLTSIKFFMGILLSVSALNTLGVLEKISEIIFGHTFDFTRTVIGGVILGLMSSIVDNVPLTALAIDMLKVENPQIWVLLAIALGTGGSVLLIGSIAGIIASSMVKELTFERYMKIASVPALISYFTAIAIWFMQYRFLLN